MKKLITLVAAIGLVAGIAVSAQASKAKTVWEDATGDADNAQALGASIPGGFDLVSGSIRRDGDNLEFSVTHADLPPTGTLPEGFRLLWSFTVDGDEFYRLSIKSADIGKPDVGQNQTTERVGEVWLNGQFRLEGDCTDNPLPAALTFINCGPLADLDGVWDPATGTVTAIVPLAEIEAKTKSEISTGGGETTRICSATVCWVTHVAERSHSSTIIDAASMFSTYKVPKK